MSASDFCLDSFLVASMSCIVSNSFIDKFVARLEEFTAFFGTGNPLVSEFHTL